MKIIQFLSILTFWSSAFGICPNGTIPYGTYCYKVFNTPTWFMHAELQCVQLNGHLASVGDNSTNFNLMTIANSSITTNSSFWIGGTTLITGSKWTWSDGRDVTFTNWVKERPLNASNTNSISMIISNGLWFDKFYGDSLPFICEIPQDLVNRCHKNGTYIESTNSCYTIGCGPVAWSDARKACMNEGGDLTSINSPWVDYFLNLIAYSSSCYPGDYPQGFDYTPMFYIGIQKLNNGTWVWTDGSNANYTNWYIACRNGTCNNYVYAGFRDILDNAWTTLPGGGNFNPYHIGYICKTSPINTIQTTQAPAANLTQTTQNPISSVALTKQTTATKNRGCNGECPVGWYQGKNNKCFCYNFYLPSDDWFGADLICDRDAKGATLASIDGVFENYEILSMANNWVASCDLIFIDLANTGNGWAWANGDQHNYTNWAKGYPINDDSLACGAMNVTTQHGQWQNIDCSLRQCFVCKLVLSK